ncbi:MAG TPA: ABC transporter substrate-binding protein [Firmicutes bacterium]|nr:ABC transporter substrate-binding protein [Bacillota bacterium]
MKKSFWVTVTLSMVLALVLFSGITIINADSKIELTFWSFFGGGESSYMQEIVNNFNKSQSEIVVKNVIQEWGTPYYTKLMTAVAAGKGPDIGAAHVSELPALVDSGSVYALDTYAKDENVNWGKINKNILDATIYDGKHYAVPLDTHPYIMYYNKNLLKKAGLLDAQGKPILASGTVGLDTFFATLKKKLPADVYPLAQPTNGDDCYRLWYALYVQQGPTSLLNANFTKSEIDMAKAVKAAEYVKSLYTRGYIQKNLADFVKTFSSGKAAVTFTGGWTTPVFEGVKGFSFGAMEFPTLMGKTATWGDSHTIILPVQSKDDKVRQDAAMKFASFVADSGKIWAQAGHVPASDAVVASAEFKALPYRSEYATAAKHVVFFSHSKNNWAMIDIIKKNLDTIWNGSTPSKTALTKMAMDIDNLVK